MIPWGMKGVGEFRLKAVPAPLAAILLIAAAAFLRQHPLVGARACGNPRHACVLGVYDSSRCHSIDVVHRASRHGATGRRSSTGCELSVAQPPASIPITVMALHRPTDRFAMPIPPHCETYKFESRRSYARRRGRTRPQSAAIDPVAQA